MEVLGLKSRLINKDDDIISAIYEALENANFNIENGDILVIASKVLAYSQGKLEKLDKENTLEKLVKNEADKILDEGFMTITLKNNILIPNSGIDNSNTEEGVAVLWPEKPFENADKIKYKIKEKYKIKDFGVVISDSHCQSLRIGTTGIAIAWSGFYGVLDERGVKDLFGKEMKYTQISVADNLSSTATLIMGETNASIPFVLIKGYNAKWTDKKFNQNDYFMEPEKCIYKSFYKGKLI